MRRALPLLLIAAACGGDSDAHVDAGPLLDAGDGDFQVARVGFVNLVEGSGFLGTYALIQDRPELPVPSAVASQGDCTVFRRPSPSLCDPPCTDAVCTAPDTCTPYAQNASAGRITVGGLRAPLAFVPGQFGYMPEPQPPGDLFDPGASISVSAAGDVTPAFAVELTAPPPLEAPFQNLTLTDGVDATITWTAGAGGPRSIQVMLVVGWHGAPPEALMVCETDDDGSLTIPGALIAQLPRAASKLEQHSSWILRFDRAVVFAPAGPIEVVAGSQVNLYFAHP
jgi:hypothetical protein